MLRLDLEESPGFLGAGKPDGLGVCDEELRRSYLENVRWHREIVRLWEAAQARAAN